MDKETIQLIITSFTSIVLAAMAIILPIMIKGYRKEVNGHMTALIAAKTGEAAATATVAEKEKAEAKADVVKAEVKAEVKVTPAADTKVDNVTIQANTAEVKAEKIIKK